MAGPRRRQLRRFLLRTLSSVCVCVATRIHLKSPSERVALSLLRAQKSPPDARFENGPLLMLLLLQNSAAALC